jgi:agmatinase
MNTQHDPRNNAATTLFGWPDIDSHGGTSGCIEVIGVPSDAGNSIASGARFGPESVRRASTGFAVACDGIDHGDIDSLETTDWVDAIDDVQRAVAEIAARGGLPLVLGGDHAISYSSVAALDQGERLNVVWFDAHTDLCEWRGGPWHNHKQVLRRIAGLPHVNRILQIGHRGITYFDESQRSEKMTLVTARRAIALDDATLLACLPAGTPVYISVDIDAVDPRAAPGTGHPVPGGLDPLLLMRLARCIAAQRNVVGLDLMEVNPLLDLNDMTSTVGAGILAAIVNGIAARREATKSTHSAVAATHCRVETSFQS